MTINVVNELKRLINKLEEEKDVDTPDTDRDVLVKLSNSVGCGLDTWFTGYYSPGIWRIYVHGPENSPYLSIPMVDSKRVMDWKELPR